jgi:hypothetical protein
LTRGPGGSEPLDLDQTVGSGRGPGGGLSPLVHGGPAEGVRLLLIMVVRWRSGGQGGPQALRGGEAAAPGGGTAGGRRNFAEKRPTRVTRLRLARGLHLRVAEDKANSSGGSGVWLGVTTPPEIILYYRLNHSI